jgi:probable F420-dependent oxidoreductase
MNVGLFALGINRATTPAIVRRTAAGAERCGFATLWVGEHVVLFDRQDSKYPYSADGEFPLDGGADWLDPFITLTFAAAVTSKIRLATGICLVPEHNPLVLAKEIASLDRLSGGRFAFGVGIGWSAEEFAALGLPFERRAARTREYIDVMRKLWSEDVTTHRGEFVSFERARSYPKPARRDKLPVIFGGESAPALRRVVEYGNGWFGFNVSPADAVAKIERLRELCRERGRDLRELELIVSPYTIRITRDDLARYRDAGVHELVMLGNPPTEEAQVDSWLERLAAEWVAPAAKLG